MMIKRIFLLTLLFFIAFVPVMADDVKFVASAPRQAISGQQFQISFTLQNATGSEFRAPEFTGCVELFGPATSQSTQMNFANGKMLKSTEFSYTYTLRADKKGTHTIAPATIKVDGKLLSSNSLTIKILPPDKNIRSQSSSAPTSQQVASSEDPDVFARLILSKTSVYEQEPILATIRVYCRNANLTGGYGNMNLPKFDGFVSQELEIQPEIELENYKDNNYQVFDIKKVLLYPQRTGDIKIESGSFDLSLLVYRPVRGFFGEIMRGQQELIRTVETRPVTIKVKSLPSPRPATYMNAVGRDLKLSSTVSHEKLKTNEAMTLKLTLSGTGNLKYIKNPEVDFPVDFDVYDPKIATNLQNTISGVKGSRTIEYTAIPRSAGDFVIPSVEFTYFDLATNSYKTLRTPEYNINVEKGETSASGTVLANFSDKEAVRHLNQDIRYIKLGNLQQTLHPSFFHGTWAYRLFYIIPIMLFLAFVLFNYKKARENADLVGLKTKKANKVATRRLKIAGKYLREHNSEHFYEETLKALWGYLGDKLQLPHSVLTRDNVAAELQKFGASENLTDSFIKVIDTCEFARYAPAASSDDMDTLYNETVELIGKMENLKRK